MKTTPERSEGARIERKAMRGHLRRLLRKTTTMTSGETILQEMLNWILARQERYDKKPGGLGK